MHRKKKTHDSIELGNAPSSLFGVGHPNKAEATRTVGLGEHVSWVRVAKGIIKSSYPLVVNDRNFFDSAKARELLIQIPFLCSNA